MTDISLEFIAKQLERVLVEQASMRTELKDLSAGQTVLTEMVFRIERSLVQLKDVLGRME